MRLRSQRIALIAVILAAFILGIIGFLYRYHFDFDSVIIDSYWGPAPPVMQLLTGLLSGLWVAVLLLALWWARRKQH